MEILQGMLCQKHPVQCSILKYLRKTKESAIKQHFAILLSCGNDLVTCGNDLLTCGNDLVTCGNDLLTCGNDFLTCSNLWE